MKLSTRGRYSTRLMLELAINYGKGPILLKDISRTQEISSKYLAQLIIPLKLAGLIRSSRGAHGGYFLAKSPKDIKLNEIIAAVEGSLMPVECIDNPGICSRSSACVTREIWAEIGQQCFKTLNKYNLEEMVRRHRAKFKGK